MSAPCRLARTLQLRRGLPFPLPELTEDLPVLSDDDLAALDSGFFLLPMAAEEFIPVGDDELSSAEAHDLIPMEADVLIPMEADEAHEGLIPEVIGDDDPTVTSFPALGAFFLARYDELTEQT